MCGMNYLKMIIIIWAYVCEVEFLEAVAEQK